MAKRKSKAEQDEQLEKSENRRYVQALALCGDSGRAARLVGIGMRQAHRALADPDGLSYLDKICASDGLTYYRLDRAQRKAILTMMIVGGVMPKVSFIADDGTATPEPQAALDFDDITPTQRLKALELLGKMEGDFIERVELDDKTKKAAETSPEVRGKLDEIYGDSPATQPVKTPDQIDLENILEL